MNINWDDVKELTNYSYPIAPMLTLDEDTFKKYKDNGYLKFHSYMLLLEYSMYDLSKNTREFICNYIKKSIKKMYMQHGREFKRDDLMKLFGVTWQNPYERILSFDKNLPDISCLVLPNVVLTDKLIEYILGD